MDWNSIGISVCFVASNGKEALEAIHDHKPDIILTDICMPGLNGTDLAQYVYTHNLDCQIIFLSGYDNFMYAKSAITYDVFEYLLKPSNPDEIIQTIQRAAKMLQSNRALNTSVTQLREELKVRKIAEAVTMHENPDVVLSKTDQTIHCILNYIDQNYMRDISLVSLSNETHFNVIYICRMLKRKTGHTFLEILMSVRMLHAARFLVSKDYKISKVAEDVGINDQKYFSQLFKRTFYVTPTEYRKFHTESSVLDISTILDNSGKNL